MVNHLGISPSVGMWVNSLWCNPSYVAHLQTTFKIYILSRSSDLKTKGDLSYIAGVASVKSDRNGLGFVDMPFE